MRTCWLHSSFFTRVGCAAVLRTWARGRSATAACLRRSRGRLRSIMVTLPVGGKPAAAELGERAVSAMAGVQVSSGGSPRARSGPAAGIWRSAGVWDATETLERRSPASLTWTEQGWPQSWPLRWCAGWSSGCSCRCVCQPVSLCVQVELESITAS